MTERTPRVAERDRLSAQRTNRIADSIDLLADAQVAASRAIAANDAQSELFRINDVSGTELLAIAGTVAPTGGETLYTVRLPPELAESSRGGVTITITDVNNATATDGTTSETWTMTKSYAVGDIVEAFYWASDGVFVDRNIAGRMWAADAVIGGGGGASS